MFNLEVLYEKPDKILIHLFKEKTSKIHFQEIKQKCALMNTEKTHFYGKNKKIYVILFFIPIVEG